MIYAGLTASLSCCLNLEQLILKHDMVDILDITWKDTTNQMYKSFYQMNTDKRISYNLKVKKQKHPKV